MLLCCLFIPQKNVFSGIKSVMLTYGIGIEYTIIWATNALKPICSFSLYNQCYNYTLHSTPNVIDTNSDYAITVVGKRCLPSAFQFFELFLHSKNPSKNFHALVRAPCPHYSIYLLLAYTPILFTTIY